MTQSDEQSTDPGAPGTRGSFPPSRLGDFVLIRRRGRGGQGEVWEARDERLGRRVALKLLARPIAFGDTQTEARLRERFTREAEAAARLDHPGICSVYEFGETEGTPWIAMRLVEGLSLREHLDRAAPDESLFVAIDDEAETELMTPNADADRSPASTDTQTLAGPDSATSTNPRAGRPAIDFALRIVASAARAVQVAHDAGLVHRDLKPGNIMVTSEGEAVILDFGLAVDTLAEGPSLTGTGELVGTPAYLTPEQIDPTIGPVDRRTDIHALGAVLYECLVRQRPFVAPTRDALYRSITQDAAPDPRRVNPAVSRDLAVVVETALAKDPAHRYVDARAFAEDLRRVREHEPILARPPGPFSRIARWARRNPLVAALLFGIIALLTCFALWTNTQNRELGRALGEYERLADLRRLADARREAEALWPLRPEIADDISTWIEEQGPLLERHGDHTAALARLDPDVADADARFRRENLARLCTELDAFANPDSGLVARMQLRLSDARRMGPATLEAPAADWRDAIERIESNPRYGGLSLRPQLGLIPLGPDPDSGLEEFLHWISHDRRARIGVGRRSGSIEMDEATGIVLVLVPGGRFFMGAQPDDPEAPNFDEAAEPNQGPVAEISLAPFFASKFETTQSQWLRLTRRNPSTYAIGFDAVVELDEPVDGRHPVETLTWPEAHEVGRRFDLLLPTEAQWEYLARTGRATSARANVAGRETRAHFNYRDDRHEDPFLLHARVGHFPADALGLHDVLGNVWEWCRDHHTDYQLPPRAGDGLRHEPTAARMIRGGAFNGLPSDARPAMRRALDAGIRDDFLGVRYVRAISQD